MTHFGLFWTVNRSGESLLWQGRSFVWGEEVTAKCHVPGAPPHVHVSVEGRLTWRIALGEQTPSFSLHTPNNQTWSVAEVL